MEGLKSKDGVLERRGLSALQLKHRCPSFQLAACGTRSQDQDVRTSIHLDFLPASLPCVQVSALSTQHASQSLKMSLLSTHSHTYTLTYKHHTHTHTRTHTHSLTHIHTQTYTHTHSLMHMCTHTHTHLHTHSYAHVYTHIHSHISTLTHTLT